MQPVTAEQVKEAAIAAGVLVVTANQCSVCEQYLYFRVGGEDLYFQSHCDCSDGSDHKVPWDDAAAWINDQEDDDETRIALMQKFGFDVGEEPETMPPADGVRIPFEWELVTNGVMRAKIFGGWIVNVQEDQAEGESICFVPDPEYKWNV